MEPIEFPSSPVINELYTSPEGDTWIWTGYAWSSVSQGFSENITAYSYDAIEGIVKGMLGSPELISSLATLVPLITNIPSSIDLANYPKYRELRNKSIGDMLLPLIQQPEVIATVVPYLEGVWGTYPGIDGEDSENYVLGKFGEGIATNPELWNTIANYVNTWTGLNIPLL